MTEKFARTIDLADGEIAAADLRLADFPLGWSGVAEVQTALHRGCNVGRPAAGDWVAPATEATIPAGAAGASANEQYPVAWLRWQAGAGGRLRVGIVASGQVLVHRSSDALEASGRIADISGLAAGDTVRRALDALFAYGGPMGAQVLSYTVASSDAGKVTAAIEDGGFLRLKAVATGSANITVTATGPAGQTARLAAFAVTVA